MTRVLEPTDAEVAEVLRCLTAFSNWGRWGADDQLGTLNLLTPDKLRAAATEVRAGRSVPLSRQIAFAPQADRHEAAVPPIHFMQQSGDSARPGRAHTAYDWAGLPLHGHYLTHLDAHGHMFWDRRTYNGTSAEAVVTDRGALRGGVNQASAGIVSRGVLLDVPAALGVDWLAGAAEVTSADLDAAERLAQTRCQPGDVILVRTGYGARRLQADDVAAPGLPGLGPDCLPWIRERDIAVLGTDTGTDPSPNRFAGRLLAPVHLVCLVAMGMWIIDNCDLEEAAAMAAQLGQYSFLFTAAPLRLKNSTGSPLNPVAVF